METDELKILEEISHKIDQLIILLKLSIRDTLEKYREEVRGDEVALKILEYADGTLSYSDIVKRVSEEIGISEVTVKRKISRLKEMGFLLAKRKGKQVFCHNSDLFE